MLIHTFLCCSCWRHDVTLTATKNAERGNISSKFIGKPFPTSLHRVQLPWCMLAHKAVLKWCICFSVAAQMLRQSARRCSSLMPLLLVCVYCLWSAFGIAHTGLTWEVSITTCTVRPTALVHSAVPCMWVWMMLPATGHSHCFWHCLLWLSYSTWWCCWHCAPACDVCRSPAWDVRMWYTCMWCTCMWCTCMWCIWAPAYDTYRSPACDAPAHNTCGSQVLNECSWDSQHAFVHNSSWATWVEWIVPAFRARQLCCFPPEMPTLKTWSCSYQLEPVFLQQTTRQVAGTRTACSVATVCFDSILQSIWRLLRSQKSIVSMRFGRWTSMLLLWDAVANMPLQLYNCDALCSLANPHRWLTICDECINAGFHVTCSRSQGETLGNTVDWSVSPEISKSWDHWVVRSVTHEWWLLLRRVKLHSIWLLTKGAFHVWRFCYCTKPMLRLQMMRSVTDMIRVGFERFAQPSENALL